MPSIVWGRHPQEAYENPYEYDAQAQFLREVNTLLSDLNAHLNRSTLSYHRDERSLEKATWMLAHDLIDALAEAAKLIEERRHRIAARLFRDCVETIDLLAVLHSRTQNGANALASWYDNRTIPHRDSRHYLESVEGLEAAAKRRTYYEELSKFTHRTYRALMASYSLGRDDLLVHDSYSKLGMLVLPQVVAAYLAVLGDLIIQASETLTHIGVVSASELEAVWIKALEANTVPRRFAIR